MGGGRETFHGKSLNIRFHTILEYRKSNTIANQTITHNSVATNKVQIIQNMSISKYHGRIVKYVFNM